jgi:hypothetical protein
MTRGKKLHLCFLLYLSLEKCKFLTSLSGTEFLNSHVNAMIACYSKQFKVNSRSQSYHSTLGKSDRTFTPFLLVNLNFSVVKNIYNRIYLFFSFLHIPCVKYVYTHTHTHTRVYLTEIGKI